MTLKNRLLVATLCAVLIASHVTSTETSWSPDWADDLSVRVHPTVGVRTVDDPSATGVIDGAWRSDKDIELATIKHVPHKDTVIIRVPPSALIKANDTVALTLHVARLIGMQRRCALNATPLEGDLDCDSGTLMYIRDVTRRPHMNLAPGLTLSESVAKACLAAHPLKLYRAARSQWQQLLGAAEKGTSKLHATRKELVLAWSIVRTRAISGPTVASAPDSSTQIMLVPLIDLANHDASDVATAKLEFQRHSEGASMNDDGTVIPNKRSDQLDVLLVTTRSLKKGTPITISYGNLRHPVDAVDTYGFLVPGFDSDRGKLDERIRALFPALPVQIGFPRDDTFFGPRGCNDEWRMVFNVTTGRPADDVLPCASLAQLKGLGEAQGLIAMQTYANGRMDKKERRQLAKAAWGLLAQSAGKLRDEEYALTADNREACAALMTSASPRVVKVVSMATAATMFMRDAVGRLQTYCNEKVKRALSTQAPKPPTTTPPPSEL